MTPIVIKTYAADASWLRHCLRSIAMHAPWCRTVVLVTEEDSQDAVWSAAADSRLYCKLVVDSPNRWPGYWSMVWAKWHLDLVCEPGPFWAMDSDTIFNRPIREDELATWAYCRHEDNDPVAREIWQPRTAALGLDPTYGFMMEPGFLLHTAEIRDARDAIERNIGVSLGDYLTSKLPADPAELGPHGGFPPPFSAYEPLGAWLLANPDRQRIARRWDLRPNAELDPHRFLTHAWSWGGYTAEKGALLDGIMQGIEPAVRRVR